MNLKEELELLDRSQLCDIAFELGLSVSISYSKERLIDLIMNSNVPIADIWLMIEIYNPL